MIYFLLFILLFLIVIFIPNGKLIIHRINQQRNPNEDFYWNKYLITVLFFIIIVSAIRDTYIGTDYSNYLDFYNYILDNGKFSLLLKQNEIGWDYLNFYAAKMNIPSSVFFGLISGIMYYFFIKGSYKFSFLLPLMFYFIFTSGFFYWTLSGLRQSIAIMIFFYSIKYIIEEKIIKYFISILIASLFHISALIILPLYFLKYIKFNQKIILIIYTISLFFIGKDWFLNYMGNSIIFISSKFNFLSEYINYLTTDTFKINDKRSSSGLGILLKIITTYYIIYKSKFILEKHSLLNIYYILFIISAISSNLFFSVEIIARVLNYLYICFPIVIASSIYYIKGMHEKLFIIILLATYFLMFLLQTYRISIIN